MFLAGTQTFGQFLDRSRLITTGRERGFNLEWSGVRNSHGWLAAEV